jgi:DNA-binding transcriptional ArsR family regulator
VLHVQCTAEDLLNISIAEHPAPLLELAMAMSSTQRRATHPAFEPWRSHIARTLPVQVRPLLQLHSPLGVGPMFVDPPSATFDEGLDQVLSTSRAEATAELQRICAIDRTRTSWIRRLAERDREAWTILARAMRTGYAAVLGDSWPILHAGFHAETAWRTRMLAQHGLRATLTALSPAIRIRGTSLEIDSPRDLRRTLDGRGIILQPTMLWTGHPLISVHPDGRLMLIYPALSPLPLLPPAPATDPLAALVGATRAHALQLLTRPHTTSQLAHQLAVTPAAASMQTKALREAGLISSRRDGKAVWHACTARCDVLGRCCRFGV